MVLGEYLERCSRITVPAVLTLNLNGVTPRVWTDFGGEFRMPSGRKKGVVDERAEKVFYG